MHSPDTGAGPSDGRQGVASAEPGPSLIGQLRDRDHTRGSLLVSIAVLAVPAILSAAGSNGLFQMADLHFLGRLGREAVAGAGATNQTLRQVLFMLVFGLTVSSQMIISQAIGARRAGEAARAAGQALLIGGLLSLVSAAIGLLFVRPLVSLVVQDAAVIPLAVAYARIAFVILFSTVFIQLLGGILGAAGDTTTPMLVAFVVAPISIAAEWILAFGRFGAPALGIQGIALGVGLGSAVGACVLSWALFTGRCRVELRLRHLLPDTELLVRLAGLSWPPALHLFARTTMVFFFMWLAGHLGAEVQAAYTIGLRLEMLAIMIAFPIANAGATLVGQSLGAGEIGRAWRSIWVTFGVELAALWPAAAVLFLLRRQLVTLFTGDPEVAALAVEYLGYTAIILLFYGLYFASFRALQAAGDMNSPMRISISVAVLLGAPLGYILATQTDLGASGMWIANLVYSGVNAGITIGWLLIGRWARDHASPDAAACQEGV